MRRKFPQERLLANSLTGSLKQQFDHRSTSGLGLGTGPGPNEPLLVAFKGVVPLGQVRSPTEHCVNRLLGRTASLDHMAGDDGTRPAVATPAMQVRRRLLTPRGFQRLEDVPQGRRLGSGRVADRQAQHFPTTFRAAASAKKRGV